MKLAVRLNMGGAAFRISDLDDYNAQEVARILHKLADRIDATGDQEGTLHDINGNGVGHWAIK